MSFVKVLRESEAANKLLKEGTPKGRLMRIIEPNHLHRNKYKGKNIFYEIEKNTLYYSWHFEYIK